MVVPQRPLFEWMSRTILFYPAGKTVEGLRPRAAPGICAGQRTGPGYLIIYSKTKPGRRRGGGRCLVTPPKLISEIL